MPDTKTTGLILAAGKGTRMHSPRAKVLQTLLGEPMLFYVYEALKPVVGDDILTVVGHDVDNVRAAFPDMTDRFVMQEEQLGTGHALQVAWDALEKSGATHCMVINGDTPLVTTEALERLAEAHTSDLAFMTITPRDTGSFGRVVRDPERRISAIVEAKDYDLNVHGPVTGEVNAGLYLLKLDTIGPLLSKLSNENKSGEYYITDLVGLAVEAGLTVEGVQAGDDLSLMGINSPRELITAENALRHQIVDALIDEGVLIHNPDTVVIGPQVEVEPGAEIFGHCEIYGKSHVAKGARMGSYNYILNATFAAGCDVRQFNHIEGATVGEGCWVGPYARLRPGAVLEKDARIGNFVEMKKARLGEGAKANHLTYLGDAEVGAGANIGAGTITCNYDGKNKFQTTIGEGAFIGSNSALVAPVNIGKDAVVGAGSTITKDVPDEQAGIARGKQVTIKRRLKK